MCKPGRRPRCLSKVPIHVRMRNMKSDASTSHLHTYDFGVCPESRARLLGQTLPSYGSQACPERGNRQLPTGLRPLCMHAAASLMFSMVTQSGVVFARTLDLTKRIDAKMLGALLKLQS